MLTVKLVEHNGHEQIYPADEVWADPPRDKDGKQDVHARLPDLSVKHFANYGVVYVMNSHGATVAKYWLGYGERQADAESPPKAA
jgi:hypothetical protein